MLLYEIKNQKIIVYSFTPCEDALIKYRKENIEKQDIDKLFYCFETNNERLKNRFVGADEIPRDFLLHDPVTLDNWWSEINQQSFTTRSQRLMREEIIENYINGAYSKVVPTREISSETVDGRYLNNYLVTGDVITNYSKVENGLIYTIENICLYQMIYVLYNFY